MPQHRKLTLREVEDYLDNLEAENYHSAASAQADLLRTLVLVDRKLVKHEETPLARQLRQAVHKMMGNTY